MAYPQHYPAPPALIAHRFQGESRLWRAGGVGDQPAAIWFQARHAGCIESILKEEKSGKENMSAENLEKLMELVEIRKRIPRPVKGQK